MIYNSVDTIPGKLYYKIEATGNLLLLSDEDNPDVKKLEEAWNKIKKENENQPGSAKLKKILTVEKMIEHLSALNEAVGIAVHCLNAIKDMRLVNMLKEYEYHFDWKEGIDTDENEQLWNEDIKRISRESNAIQVRLDAAKEKLPKDSEEPDINDSSATFDLTCLSHSTFVDAGFVDTNTIVLSQFNAIVHLSNQKIKALKNGKG